jgi:hypothetical protein
MSVDSARENLSAMGNAVWFVTSCCKMAGGLEFAGNPLPLSGIVRGDPAAESTIEMLVVRAPVLAGVKRAAMSQELCAASVEPTGHVVLIGNSALDEEMLVIVIPEAVSFR